MNIKLLLGVIIPVLLIITLAVLGSIGGDFYVETEVVEEITLENLFGQGDGVLAKTITVYNDFFMPRKYEFPNYIACLHDSSNGLRNIDFTVIYEETIRSREVVTPIYEELITRSIPRTRSSVDVNPYSEKEINIFLNSLRTVDIENRRNQYEDYDQILLIEEERSSLVFSRCFQITDEQKAAAIRIPVI